MISLFSSLPVEIIELVACQLEFNDLLSFRQVCKQVYESTLRHFGRVCLETFTTDLSYESLQKLKDLSQDERFRHHVHTLLITDIEGLGDGYTWTRHASGHLTAPLPGVDMLRAILVDNLVNCRSFRLYRTFGMEVSYDHTGIGDRVSYSDTIAVILLVIAETGLPIRSLRLDWDNNGGTHHLKIKRLKGLDFQTPSFWTGWTHLEELVLHNTLSPDALDFLSTLVLRATNLLRLEIGPETESYDDALAFFERLCPASAVPKLQELMLESQSFTEDFFATFIAGFGHSLRALSLKDVHIILRGSWKAVIERWRTDLPLLERIAVVDLVEYNLGDIDLLTFPSLRDDRVVPGTNGGRFQLTEESQYEEKRTVGATYAGPDMSTALEVLLNAIEVLRF
ncbi:hypothetical protein MMC34_000187 [Xylographa carneopallida]|nr:hypothetical protein [Xylographa carneopallida]